MPTLEKQWKYDSKWNGADFVYTVSNGEQTLDVPNIGNMHSASQAMVAILERGEKPTKEAIRNQIKETAREELRQLVKPGDTVYTILRHVSTSGMSRDIDVVLIKDNEPLRITYTASEATGITYDRKAEALKVGGCGMDMGFHVVYTLGCCLWPKGTPTPHGKRNGQPDSDGGYALKHRWL